MKKARRPLSLRERLERSHSGQSYYAAMAGKPPPPLPKELQKPKRAYTPPDPADSEAPVLKAVGDLLAVHPKVLFAVRQNSGGTYWQDSQGDSHAMWFYRLMRRPGASQIAIPDYWGWLTDGRPFALECKRPSWKAPRTPRELNQQAFIHMLESIGGVGGFVRSGDEAMAILRGKVE